MVDFKENLNPFDFEGYIGRKFYFLIAFCFGAMSYILQFAFCKHIFKSIVNASMMHVDMKLINILQNSTLPKSELVIFFIIVIICSYVSLVLAKKRFFDITGDAKKSLGYSLVLMLTAFSLYFLSIISPWYMIVTFLYSIFAFVLFFKKGKFVVPDDAKIIGIENEIRNGIENEIEAKKIVSFWRRALAYFIDNALILKIVTILLGVMASDFLFKLGGYGIIIGFVLFILYFGIMNSRICNGQTLGKMAMGVKVVNKDGEFLDVRTSVLRAVILALCVITGTAFLNTAVNIWSVTIAWTPKIYLSIILGYGLFLAFAYLFVFNFKTRQTIHDLSVKSYVVTADFKTKLKNFKSPIYNTIISCFIFLAFSISINHLVTKIVPIASKDLPFIVKMNKELQTNVMWISFLPETKSNESVLKILVRTPDINDKAIAKNVGDYMIKNSPYAKKSEQITVQLIRSYTLGTMADRIIQTYPIKNK